MPCFRLDLSLILFRWIQVEAGALVKLVEHYKVEVLPGELVIKVDLCMFEAVGIDTNVFLSLLTFSHILLACYLVVTASIHLCVILGAS